MMGPEKDRLNAALAVHLKDTGITDCVCPVHGSNALLDHDEEGGWRCVEITGLHDICWEEAVVAEVARDYCGSLDRAVEALNALGLEWDRYRIHGMHAEGDWHVDVAPKSEGWGSRWLALPLPDGTPATLAKTLVEAALCVLGVKGEANDDGE